MAIEYVSFLQLFTLSFKGFFISFYFSSLLLVLCLDFVTLLLQFVFCYNGSRLDIRVKMKMQKGFSVGEAELVSKV